MKKDVYTPTRKDIKDPKFTGFLDQLAQRMSENHISFDSTTGVLGD
jgi:hypothetical protein